MVSHLEVFWCERINTAKQKDGLTSSFMLSVLKAKIFEHDFLENIRCAKITITDRQLEKWSCDYGDWTRIFGLHERHISCIGDRIGRNFEPWDKYYACVKPAAL